MLLEEVLVKQFYKDKSSHMFYSVSMQGNVVTAVEGISGKLTGYTPRYVMVPIDRESMQFPVFILQLPRGGQCRVLWQMSVFFEATQMKGYSGKSSKWVHDRLDAWQQIMNHQRYLGCHLFKSTASKRPGDILHSIECFLPNPSMTTVAMMTLLPRMAYGTVKQGGAKDAPARVNAGNIFRGVVAHSHKEPFTACAIRPCQIWLIQSICSDNQRQDSWF